MKFLCDNCKAKYQIGDDKVAGKTVRMKCRRCGHSITVSSKVTESSVSRQMPVDPNVANEPTFSVPPGYDASPESGAGPRPVDPRGRPPEPRPRPPMRSDADDESTQIMQLPVRPEPVRPGAPPARPRPAAGAPPPPRASGVGGAPAALRAPAPPRPIGAAALRAPAAAPVRDLRQAPLQPVPKPAPSPPQPAVDPSGVAAAFQRAVADPHATSSSRHPPHEDWYVGVGGQPLGPVRVDVIREKAMLGQVDGESLVWREGFDEWQPLKKFPELLEVVHGARMSRLAPRPPSPADRAPSQYQPRPGVTPEDPRARSLGAAAALSAPAGGIRHASIAGAADPLRGSSTGGSYGTQAMPVAPSPSPPVGLAARGADPAPFVARAPEPPPAALVPAAPAPVIAPVNAVSVLADPFAAPAAPGPSKPAPEPPEPARAPANGLSLGQPSFLVPPPAADKPVAMFPPSPPLAAGPASSELSALIPKRTGMHPMAYAFIAMAAVFGGVAAYFLFFKPPPAPQVIIKEVQVPGAPAVAGAATSEPQAAASDATTTPTGTKVASGGGRVRSTTAATPTSAPAAPAGAPIDTSGFSNGGVGGPSNAGGPTPGNASGTLSQGEIQGVVSSNQARIRRQCWEPALAGRPANAPTNARVNATMTIGPSGSVESANASGADAYPGLASCIAGKMKSWRFPPSGGSQTVQVPFVFAGQ